ncbi:hypothetical protein [Streptomyces virginiae]|uniref:hypothetical protein n=1 Tax=Streptomyces virginiae TaxID=1961 RepID=UPI00225A7BD0|nr:hypothetical protein [Streptomyces virginiae]MCX5275701.1 hypothetical protein [Streptomyces virginiae]
MVRVGAGAEEVEAEVDGSGVLAGFSDGVVGGIVGFVGVGARVVGGWVGWAFLVLVKATVVGAPGFAVIFTGVESSW